MAAATGLAEQSKAAAGVRAATAGEIEEAARTLRAGGVVAHANEGVWGLACDPFNEAAVRKTHTIKGRDAARGLIVIGDGARAFEPELAVLGRAAAARVRAGWPGAVTWIVANARFPEWITGDRGTVAIRVPGHRQARALARAFGGPIVSTSANRTGEPPATTAEAVRAALGNEVDYLLFGAIGDHAGPSRIFDAASGERLR